MTAELIQRARIFAAEREGWIANLITDLADALAASEARNAAALALHDEDSRGYCIHCSFEGAGQSGIAYPCPTVVALGGEPA